LTTARQHRQIRRHQVAQKSVSASRCVFHRELRPQSRPPLKISESISPS
jgi:hypothetical protein